jgi:hypothetical protein
VVGGGQGVASEEEMVKKKSDFEMPDGEMTRPNIANEAMALDIEMALVFKRLTAIKERLDVV